MKLWGYSRLIVELRWPFLFFHIIRMIRNWEEKEEMGGKKKRPRGEKRNECVGRRRCCPPPTRPTLSAHCTRDGADWMAPDQNKKEEKGKNCHQAVVGRERKKRPGGTAGQRERQQQPTDRRLLLGRSIVRVDSIKHHLCAHHLPTRTHTHIHTRGSTHTNRGRHTITALLFSSLLSSQCARTEINKRPKKTRGV